MCHRDETGALVRYDGLVEDITNRKWSEQALGERVGQLIATQEIQEHILPRVAPAVPGFDLAGGLIAAEFAAGGLLRFPLHARWLVWHSRR